MAFHWLICDSLLLSESCQVSLAVLGLCCGTQALHCRAGVLWFQPAGAALVAVHRRFMAVGGHIAERRLRYSGSVLEVHRLCCTMAFGTLVPGPNPCAPALASRFLTTGHSVHMCSLAQLFATLWALAH